MILLKKSSLVLFYGAISYILTEYYTFFNNPIMEQILMLILNSYTNGRININLYYHNGTLHIRIVVSSDADTI